MQPILLLGCFCLALVSTALSQTAPQEKLPAPRRFALVIGNAHYPNGANLRNPLHDADSLAQVLREVQFEVQVKKNLTYLETKRCLQAFGDSLNPQDFYLIYYAGHGIWSGVQSYILPVDAQVEGNNILNECIPIAELFSSKRASGAVLLDACFWDLNSRNITSFGIEKPAENSILMYAGVDTVWDGDQTNSPFNIALRQKIQQQSAVFLEATQRQEIHQILAQAATVVKELTHGKQSPLLLSRLRKPFYFHLYNPR